MNPIIGCHQNEQRIYNQPPLTRVYPVDQLFAVGSNLRAGQQLTRDQGIAIEEHRQFHERLNDFGSDLPAHIALMEIAILSGKSFMESHEWAIANGPKPR